MSVNDVDRAIVKARALFDQLDKLAATGLAGLAEAQHGISPPPDNGARSAPGSKPPPGTFHREHDMTPHDDPAQSLRRAEHAAQSLLIGAQRLYDELVAWHRLGLPRDHKDRRPTQDERLAADERSLDDDETCTSCIRQGAFNPRLGGTKLCSWCAGIVRTYKDQWPQMTMPPIDLVRAHIEAQNGRTRITTEHVERSLRICYGTPRKATA